MFIKLLQFFGLKIVEISAILFIPYGIGNISIINKHILLQPSSFYAHWLVGFLGIGIVVLTTLSIWFIIGHGLLRWINFNWKLVNKGDGIYWIECLIN